MVVEGFMQYVWDETGRRYLDAFAGIVTISVGHCHPKVIERVREQTGKLQHTTTIYLHPTIVEFAESVDELVVIEEKRPFVETQLRSILHEGRSTVPVMGKRDLAGDVLAPSVGELTPSAVGAIVTRVLPTLPSRRSSLRIVESRG